MGDNVILRFDTHDAAAIFAGRKRAEGHFAEILDEGTGFLWGPMATGGFRVVVSDEPVDEEMSDKEPPHSESELGRFFRYGVVAWVLLGLVVGVVVFARSAAWRNESMGSLLIYAAAVPLISLLLFPLFVWMTRALRDGNSQAGNLLKALVFAFIVATLLLELILLIVSLLGWI